MAMRPLSTLFGSLVFGGLLAGAAPAQLVMHEETAWTPGPFAMGDYDEQTVPILGPGPYAGPINPAGSCVFPPPFPPGPAGLCGATLWHTETNCCGTGAAPPGWGPTFAAYNQGDLTPPVFDYFTFGGGLVFPNAGAISSYGIGGVTYRLGSAISPNVQQIVLCFDYVKVTEGGGNPAFDTADIEVRAAQCSEAACLDPLGLAPWSAISHLSTPNNGCGGPITCCIGPGHPALDGIFIGTAAGGGGGKIRFRFDTRDAAANSFCGWQVDNVRLTNEECDPPCFTASPWLPQIGSTGGEPISPNPAFAITLSAAPPASPAFLIVGLNNLPPLPIGSPGLCLLCCQPFLIIGPITVGPLGTASLPVAIPAGLPPCQVEVCFQWAILTALPPIPGVYTSSSGKVRIQLG